MKKKVRMASDDNSTSIKASEETTIVSKEWSIRQRLGDAEYRGKLLHSLWIAMTLFALGATAAQGGPTFLDLQIITKTNVEKASTFFTSRSCGELTGSILSGLIGYKINSSLLILLSTLSMGATTITVPYCSIYGLMIFVKFLGGLSEGILNTTGNAENMRIWGSDGRVITQFLHFCVSLGCMLSPLITEPFVAGRTDNAPSNSSSQSNDLNHSANTEPAAVVVTYSGQNYRLSNKTDWNTTKFVVDWTTLDDVNENAKETNVHYAFLIVGILTFIVSLPFLYMFVNNRARRETHQVLHSQQSKLRKLPLHLHIFIVFCLCIFYFSCRCIEDIFAGFLMSFVVREFSFVSKRKGAYLTAVYWGCYAVTRFLVIFVSKVLNSVKLLILCGLLMLTASVSFTICATYAAMTPLTVFTGMAGLSMAAVFPAGLSWCESELVRVTPRVSSSIFVSAAIGAMLSPLLLASLMEHAENMWFCYLLLIEVGICSSVYVFLLLFSRFYVNKKYGPLHGTVTSFDVSETFIDKENDAFYKKSLK